MIEAPQERASAVEVSIDGLSVETKSEQGTPAFLLRPGAVFRQTMRDNLGGILAWGAGYSVLIVAVVVLYPILDENNTLLSVINGLGLLDMVAENYPVDVNALASFPGYLAFEALGWGPTILSIYVIPQALSAIMGEEQRGTLDLLLSTAIPRWQLMTEKVLALIVSLAAILFIMWCVVLISTRLVEGVELAFWQASAGIWHIFPVTSIIAGITLVFSVMLRNPRLVGGLSALFVLGSYFLRSVADATGSSFLDTFRQFSIYAYFSSAGTMLDGVRWHIDLPITLLGLSLMIIAILIFQRRDIGV